MIITLKKNAPQGEIDKLHKQFEDRGLQVSIIQGENWNVWGLVGDTTRLDERLIQANEWVENVQRVQAPYKLANRMFHPQDTIVDLGHGIRIGNGQPIVLMAGPCAVEGKKEVEEIAEEVHEAGAKVLRGGAYKPRTSPYSFQGLGHEGILDLYEAGQKNGMPIVSEIMSADKLDEFVEYVDVLQIGARNMQNFDLLKAVGHTKKPVLLKRGMSATIEEWIMSAEYIMSGGNPNVIFCERGIRTYETFTRNTLDLSAVAAIKELSHLPIIVDPSHGTGRWEMVRPMARAAVAAGCDGLIIEVHPHPEVALSDGDQSLTPKNFNALMGELGKICTVMGRTL